MRTYSLINIIKLNYRTYAGMVGRLVPPADFKSKKGLQKRIVIIYYTSTKSIINKKK